MPYRAMALVAANLLFATQCYAENTVAQTRSNTYKQTPQTGSQTKNVGGGKGGAARSEFSWDIAANKERRAKGGGSGAGGAGKRTTAQGGPYEGGAGAANAASINSSRPNTYRTGSPQGGTGPANARNVRSSKSNHDE